MGRQGSVTSGAQYGVHDAGVHLKGRLKGHLKGRLKGRLKGHLKGRLRGHLLKGCLKGSGAALFLMIA